MARRIIEWLYLQSAVFMPLWFEWQWIYAMRARFYFEFGDDPRCWRTGWPWNWQAGPVE